MKLIYFIGIDVSKSWLDFALVKQNQQIFHLRADNTLAGIQVFVKQLKKLEGFDWKNTLFCMEHTGIYKNHLLGYLYKKKAQICLESGMQIKQSLGVQRGKNDKVDAGRIAFYAYKNREELTLWQPKRQTVQQLSYLSTLRSRLINVQKQLKTPVSEASEFVDSKLQKQACKLCKSSLENIEKDIYRTDKAIKELIASDQELNRLFNLITSVEGVGKVTATEMIICTNEFKDIKEAKKFACYSGVAPFEHSSGSSIRGRNRVSKMGNKAMKTLLHMAALSAVNHNQDLKAFFERKLAEGKNKMAVLNAVRNKLIHRIFACVTQNRKYEKIFPHPLA